MPVSVDQYENLAGQVLEIYDQAEQKMTDRITRRLARGINSPGWTEKKYAEMQAMNKELRSVTDFLKNDRQSIQDSLVKLAYENASKAFVNEARDVAGLMNVEHLSPNVVKVINILTDLNNSMDVADRNILRRADDAYADIVGKTSALMATGTITAREAVQMELNQFANQGIGSFVDKAGRVWDMATYAEMATLTAIERATIAGYTDTMQEYGYDLAQISSHFGACPLCEAWQGVIISVTGKTSGYHTLADAEDAGVFHPRCLHFLGTYYEGISTAGRRNPRPVTLPNIGYSARSKQRGFERCVRMWKRRMAAAVTPEDERRAYAHVREYQERIRKLLGDYNAEQPLEVDHLFRKWYREGGRVTLSPEAKRIAPYQIPKGWQAKPVSMTKLNMVSTSNPALPEPPETSRTRETPPHVVVQGKDITTTWKRSPDEFKFEIEDVIHAQGFDGVPRLASKDEFDRAVRESSFIAQRTYSAPTQEVADDYQNQLYFGKWYVDCSTGGAQYGQGMYCAADYDGKLSDGIREEMRHYQGLNRSRGSSYAKTETLTLDASAKIVKFQDLFDERQRFQEEYRNSDVNKIIAENLSLADLDKNQDAITFMRFQLSIGDVDWDTATEARSHLSKDELFDIGALKPQTADAVSKSRTEKEMEYSKKYGEMDLGSFAAMRGYDAINAEGHGQSGSYTVILNRTKCIFLEG